MADGYVYTHDGVRGVWTSRSAPSGGGRPGATYARLVIADCLLRSDPSPDPGGIDVGSCPLDIGCEVNGVQGLWSRVWARQLTPVAEANYTPGEPFCSVPGPEIPDAVVTAAAAEYLRKHVDPAVPVVLPRNRTLVNFPNIVSTVDPGEVAFALTEPLPGVVRVSPSFRWTFTSADGSTRSAEGAGRAYDGVTSPRTASPGYYLTATFRGSGTGRVALTATWEGTVTVDGNAPVDLDPLVYDDGVDLQIQQRRPVLLDPYGD